jgi:transcriptional regulator with GAF, ATPase, and Fis domain
MARHRTKPPGTRADEGTSPVDRDPPGFKLRTHTIRIEVVKGPDAGKAVELPGPAARIGSAEECDFVLGDRTVSRVHLILRIEKDRIRILDQGSRNGTSIDGTQVVDAYARPDSSITIGDSTLRLRMLADLVELPISPHDRLGRLLGRSVTMRSVFTLLERIAAVDDPVLLEGETGTGKELAAEAIHEASPRADKPFVVFDCASVSATLIEDELFGHVRGAFTGAERDRAGRFEEAEGGTLFLDEIGELPMELQPKLLGALERHEIRRIGDNRPRSVDVRVVAATNRPLAREVDFGRFREDLYHRLVVISVRLPPLRERMEDISLLVRSFEEARASRGKPLSPLPEAALRAFAEQAWPGNVRELRNAVNRAHALGLSPARGGGPAAALPVVDVDLGEGWIDGRDRLVEAYERAYLSRVLVETGGNVSRAAKLAGVGRRFIQKALLRYGLRGGG